MIHNFYITFRIATYTYVTLCMGEVDCNISYIALCPVQYLDMALESTISGVIHTLNRAKTDETIACAYRP